MIRVKPKYCAIVPIDDPDKVGHIYIPDVAKDRVDQGIVKYVGRDCTYVKPLDYVTFGGYNGQLVYIENEGRLIIVNEDFITARIDKDDIDYTEIKDLYVRTRDGYTTVTYETAIDFLARAITNASWFQDKINWDVRNVTEKSKPNQYRELQKERGYKL